MFFIKLNDLCRIKVFISFLFFPVVIADSKKFLESGGISGWIGKKIMQPFKIKGIQLLQLNQD
jgi:hypothetical protein